MNFDFIASFVSKIFNERNLGHSKTGVKQDIHRLVMAMAWCKAMSMMRRWAGWIMPLSPEVV